MSKKLNNSLIKDEENREEDDEIFIENILTENSFFLKDSKNKCCDCSCCTKIPLSLCFFMIASIFLVILLGSFVTIGILLMKSLYKEINDLYFTNFVIDPIINKKTNSTQAFNIKNEILDSIYLESKLTNLQIATEFVIENLNEANNDTISKMTQHNTTNNNFNCIRTDDTNEKNICGKNSVVNPSNEINYYIYTKNTKNIDNNDFKNLFSSLTHYFKLFENNLEYNDIFDKNILNIKEYFLYFQYNETQNNPDRFKIMLTYCYNWNTENGLIENIFESSNFNYIINEINLKTSDTKVENEIESNSFEEYMLNNDFNDEEINQFNYLKIKTFNTTYKGKEYNVLLGIRLDSDSINNLFNKQNSNMTTIAPIVKLTSSDSKQINESELHLIFNSKYFYDFFEYGLKNLINEITSTRPYEEYAQELEYENTNITTFFNILNYVLRNEEQKSYLYNKKWKEDFITIIKLIVDIIGKDYLPQFSCDEEKDDNDKILCEINNENNKAKSEIIFSNIKNKENDGVIKDLNETCYFIHQRLKEIGRTTIYYRLIQDAFTDLVKKKSNTKIFFYNSSVTNISFNSIEVLNIKTYNNLKEEFIKEMDDIEYIVILIRVGLVVLFLIISLIKIIHEVFMTINRINSIISLKDMLFNKNQVKNDEEKETLDLFNNEKDKVLSNFSEKVEREELLEEENIDESLSDKDEDGNKFIYGNTVESEKEKNIMRERWSKAHFYENNFLDEGNKLIKQYTYNKLKNIFENMDFFQNEKFAEKLVFLKRRYKLNEQYEDKDDCELSSDIYQAISKISMINMDDIFYNVYYNQSYALNQSFKMFKSILDNSINKQSIPLRNNKYINFGRILKFIYHVKKEKIQKIIEIIYGKDLKHKSKKEDEKNNIDNNFNENIFNMKINSPQKNNIVTKSNLFHSEDN